MTLRVVLSARYHGNVHIHARGYPAGLVAYILCCIGLVSYTFDPRGLFVEELRIEKKLSTLYQAIFSLLERRLFLSAKKVIFVTNNMKLYYQKKFNLEISDYRIAYNRPSDSFKVPDSKDLIDFPKFVYIGGGSKYQNIERIIKLYTLVERRIGNATMDVFIPKAYHSQIFNKFLEHGTKNYNITEIDNACVPELLRKYHYGFLVRDNSVINHVASPIKFGEYVGTGVKVVITDSVGDLDLLSNSFVTVKISYDLNDDDISKIIINDVSRYVYKPEEFKVVIEKISI